MRQAEEVEQVRPLVARDALGARQRPPVAPQREQRGSGKERQDEEGVGEAQALDREAGDSGPSEPESEKPSASQAKFIARRSAPPCAPKMLFMPMCTCMKPMPSSTLETNSAWIEGKK